jgi:acyl carrier protein
VEYVYTDVSPAFIHHGRRTFGEAYTFTRFVELNIEQDPVPQGFTESSFDIVLASNVLHATRNIVQSLENVRTLMRPGGSLLLNEMTESRDFATLTFGLLDGWWLYDDAASRIPNSPLLDVARWERAFGMAGLSLRAVHGDPGVQKSADFSQCVLECSCKVAETAHAAGTSSLDEIRNALCRVVAEVFEIPLDQVERGDIMSFTDLGADSVLGAELVTKINNTLHIDLKNTAIFNHPNIRELTQHIYEEFLGVEPSQAEAEFAPEEEDLASLLERLEAGQVSFEEAMSRVPGELV